MPKNSERLAESLRQQILKALETGLWKPGGKLPSTREMASSMGVDPRVVADAYRELSADGLINLRSRSGAYISEAARSNGSGVAPSEAWIADILADAIARELPISDMAEWVRRATETLRLNAFVVAPTRDQVQGLRRELRTYYGFEASGETLNKLESSQEAPPELRRADILVTTEACLEPARQLSAPLGIPCICVSVRLDLIGPAWQSLMQSPSYVVVTDESFGAIVQGFLSAQADATRVKVLVTGRDDLAAIPADAVVYVTQSAREQLGEMKLNGSVLPPARVLSRESSRELTFFIVEANLAAVRSRPRRDV